MCLLMTINRWKQTKQCNNSITENASIGQLHNIRTVLWTSAYKIKWYTVNKLFALDNKEYIAMPLKRPGPGLKLGTITPAAPEPR